jgi:hypothetical protein
LNEPAGRPFKPGSKLQDLRHEKYGLRDTQNHTYLDPLTRDLFNKTFYIFFLGQTTKTGNNILNRNSWRRNFIVSFFVRLNEQIYYTGILDQDFCDIFFVRHIYLNVHFFIFLLDVTCLFDPEMCFCKFQSADKNVSHRNSWTGIFIVIFVRSTKQISSTEIPEKDFFITIFLFGWKNIRQEFWYRIFYHNFFIRLTEQISYIGFLEQGFSDFYFF